MNRRKTTKPLGVLLILLGLTSLALGGSTGKIAGTVNDQKTREPLIGVNVVLEGTMMGASTDLSGRYVILNVPPGTYNVSASMIGYSTVRVTNVRVNIDLTSTVDFQLAETLVEFGETVEIIADRPLVQRDLTATTAVVSKDQLQALPVTEFSQILSLQAGFVAGSLRGGRRGEVAYWIDGVPVTDAFDGSQVVEVNKNLIEEVQMVSGAFNAEYGQAMSGIVNIATREGSRTYTGGIGVYAGDYLSGHTDIFTGIDRVEPWAIRNFEGNISGPILSDNLTFFANARHIYFDGHLHGLRRFQPWNIAYTDSAGRFQLYRDPDGKGDSSLVPMNWSRRNYGQGKITWRVSPLLKINYNLIYDETVSKAYNRIFFYNPDGIGTNTNTSLTHILQLTHTLSASTFYTFGASYFDKELRYYLYQDPNDPRYVHPKLFLRDDAFSALTGGTDLGRFRRYTKTQLIKVDLSSQIDMSNLVKLGVEVRRHHVFYQSIQLQPVLEQTDIDLAKDSPFIRTRILDVSSNSHDLYRRKPWEVSAYVQDKMEFRDLIVNIGIRFDMFKPDGSVLRDPSDPSIYNPIKPGNIFHDTNGNGIQDPGEPLKTAEERRQYWYTPASDKYQLSPRFGASFPITERGVVHFSYGYFFQIPRFERLYENPDFKLGSGTGNVGVVGNADLKPEQTINAELGIQQQVSDDISVDLSAYIRDVRNLTGTRGEEIVIFGGSATYSKYINSDFGFIKGVILSMNKRFEGGIAASMDYTYQVARGSASDPQEARNAVAGGALPEVQLVPLGWDQRHTLNATFSYDARDWGFSFIGQYGSGTPYTPRRSADITTLLTNSQTKPTYFNLDGRAYIAFDLPVARMILFARFYNIFDTLNEFGVFDDTGRAGFTTDELRTRTINPAERINTIEQWYTNPTFYSEPRRIEIGFNLEF